MKNTLCGADCQKCEWKDGCGGCAATGGQPFGGACAVAACCLRKGHTECGECGSICGLKERIIAECNSLGIAGMEPIDCLYSLKGSFVNLAYRFPDGQTVRLLDDNRIYLGTQIPKADSDRCYGIAADENILVVSEYGKDGANPELILYKKRR